MSFGKRSRGGDEYEAGCQRLADAGFFCVNIRPS